MDWIKTTDRLPAEGQEVETMISDDHGERNKQELIRIGCLWYLTDMSMYVYYTPTHWRPLPAAPGKE